MECEQSVGCVLGLALGDAFGAPYEGGIPERAVWAVIGRTVRGKRRWTDDTAMSLALAESLLFNGCLDQDDLAHRFAQGYAWSRGYGAGAARALKAIRRGVPWREASKSAYPEGSFGNGAAMRTPVLALAFRGDALVRASHDAAVVTHAHPDAIAGAELVARATELAFSRTEPLAVLEPLRERCGHLRYAERLVLAEQFLKDRGRASPRTIRAQLGSGVAALDSCVTAIFAAVYHDSRPFHDLARFVADVGGDVDTVGAMAGAIWGAKHGASALPKGLRADLEGEERIVGLALALHSRFAEHAGVAGERNKSL